MYGDIDHFYALMLGSNVCDKFYILLNTDGRGLDGDWGKVCYQLYTLNSTEPDNIIRVVDKVPGEMIGKPMEPRTHPPVHPPTNRPFEEGRSLHCGLYPIYRITAGE